MSNWLLGLVGVIAGVLSTGALQVALARVDRRRRGRVAACIIWGSLVRCVLVAEPILERALTSEEIERLKQRGADWQNNRKRLAIVLRGRDWLFVDASFHDFDRLATGETGYGDLADIDVRRWKEAVAVVRKLALGRFPWRRAEQVAEITEAFTRLEQSHDQ